MSTPRWVWPPAAVAVVLVVLPLAGVAAGVPWGRLGAVLGAPASVDALLLSLRTSLAATALVVALGLPLALVLAGLRGPLGRVLRVVVLSPLVLPPVVSGLALLAAFGRRGLAGGALGGALAYSTLAVVLAQAFVALPFFVLAVDAALRSRDPRAEGIAATLGAGPTRVLCTVTLPGIGPALLTGAVLALARALGEFGATLTFAGSLQGVTRTLPLEIYLQRETDPGGALGLALLLVAVAVAVVAALHGRPSWAGRARPAADPDPREPGRVSSTTLTASGAPVGLTVDAAVVDRGCVLALDVPAGACVAVVGPNGAGKSTLLDLVAGLAPPSSGHVHVDGDDVTRLPPHRRDVGLLAQTSLLLPRHRVLDDVAYGLRARGVPDAAARARRLLDALGIGHLAGRRGTTLSGGQAQRVALARALATDPRVLLLDEPFAALDVTAAAMMRAAVADVRAARPVTTLLVTHDPADVRALATHVAVVEGGRVVEHGPVDAVRSPFAQELLGAPEPGRA